jgi:hypothetical protein
LAFQISKGPPQIRRDFSWVRGDRVIGSTVALTPDGRRQARYQVITFRDGKITDMQSCRNRREAERFARRHN